MNDEQRIRLIRQIGYDLMTFLYDEKVDREVIKEDQVIQWTITTPLYNIGEQVYCLSSSFKERHPDIPWLRISGMRHRLVHDYVGTNWSIVADAVLRDIPVFLERLNEIDVP